MVSSLSRQRAFDLFNTYSAYDSLDGNCIGIYCGRLGKECCQTILATNLLCQPVRVITGESTDDLVYFLSRYVLFLSLLDIERKDFREFHRENVLV